MSGNRFGTLFQYTTWGESYPAVARSTRKERGAERINRAAVMVRGGVCQCQVIVSAHYFNTPHGGESHGPAIGVVIDGVPPRIPLSEEDIQFFLISVSRVVAFR